MEGSGDRPLPEEKAAKGGNKKKIAVITVVVILLVAAILAALVLTGEKYVEPTAKFTVPSEVNQGEYVIFNATTSAGKITNYTWTLGDGVTKYTTTPLLNYTYTAAGAMLATLVVTDAKKSVTSDPAKISVIAQAVTPSNTSAPVAVIVSNAEVTQNVVANGTAVTLNGDSSYTYTWNGSAFIINPGAINNYTWKLDGAVAAYTQNYTTPTTLAVGTHFVSLTVADTKGGSGQYIVSIVVLASSSGSVSGKTFVMVTIGEPDTLDPAVDYETSGGEILQNVYETLVWYDKDSAANLTPLLATAVPTVDNGGISADGKNYTFHLRENVKFHDGNIMTSEDVKYSIQRLLMMNDPDGPAWILGQVLIPNYATLSSANQSSIDNAITITDANTVVFHLITPYPAFLYCMAFTEASIVSKAYVEAHGGIVKETRNEWMSRHEAGTGPYSLVEWASNQYILMQRNDNYWRTPAAIQYVIIKKVQDVGTREMLLFNGDADCAYIPRNHASDVIGNSNLNIVQGLATFNLDFLGLNQAINTSGSLNPGVPSTFFADKNIRLAFTAAFNYSNYLDVTLGGSAVQPNGVIPSGMFGYNASIPKYNFDLQAAANYLKNATNPSTGTSYADTGFTIKLFYNAGNGPREDACFLLKNGLEALKAKGLISGNIVVTVQALDWPTYLDAVRTKQMPAFFLGWAPDYADPDDYVNPFIDSAGTYAKRCGIVNDELTNLTRAAGTELNTTLRAELYSNISLEVYNNAYYVWTDQATNFHVERTWVTGYYYNPMYSGLYYYALDKTV
jgi:peptide/nickel transport system substrate-binding protein